MIRKELFKHKMNVLGAFIVLVISYDLDTRNVHVDLVKDDGCKDVKNLYLYKRAIRRMMYIMMCDWKVSKMISEFIERYSASMFNNQTDADMKDNWYTTIIPCMETSHMNTPIFETTSHR